MNIILKTSIKNLGDIGEIKDVADGYARNYLIPRGLAMQATKNNLKQIEQQKKREAKTKEKEKEQAEKFAKDLSTHSYTVSKRAGEEDKLFGTVTSADITEAIKKEGIEIDKKQIQLEEPIKKLGIYQVSIKFYPNVIAKVKIWVVKE
jgi:large subunit ribosomal protein L9